MRGAPKSDAYQFARESGGLMPHPQNSPRGIKYLPISSQTPGALMTRVRVLNLGAGVQSTAVYLMMRQGLIAPADFAIFADTQDEPEAVYAHLAWLQSLNSIPILVRSKGRLSDHLRIGTNSTGGRFASIPAYTAPHEGMRATGAVRRQCSKEYKIEVIDRTIRREILE
jgi:hypothetical protein